MLVEPESFEWSPEDTQAFYTALDILDQVVIDAGGDSNQILMQYFEQKRSGLVEPAIVLNRMANATNRWASKP